MGIKMNNDEVFVKKYGLNFIGLILLGILCLQCASDRPKGKTQAEVLYKEALQMIDEQRYLLATERLNELRSQHPYSYYATHAELLQADVLFNQENYIEAAQAYLLFKDFHPKHDKIDYVIWRVAESYYNQLPSTHDRDLTPGHQAIDYYRELINKFPQSKYLQEAKAKINQCEKMIKDKEKYIADFYFRTEVFDAAEFRYKKIINTFQDDQLLNHSALQLVKISYETKDFKKCLTWGSEFKNRIDLKTQEKMESILKDCKEKL